MQTKDCIAKRRSVRGYNSEDIVMDVVERLVGDAILAPSGMNRQPWKFYIEGDKEKIEEISSFSASQGDWIKTSRYLVFVFLDKSLSYNEERDLMAIGAAIENFMLSACDEGIGTCWLGGILSNTDDILGIIGQKNENLSLKAIITVGKFDEGNVSSKRRPLEEVLL